MRYVRFQTIVEKVVDEIVDDSATIKSILSTLKSNEMTCTLQLSDGPKMSNVRIDKIDDSGFAFRVINRRSTLSKVAKFIDVEYLEVSSDVESLCRNKPNVTRWTLLDSSSGLSNEE